MLIAKCKLQHANECQENADMVILTMNHVSHTRHCSLVCYHAKRKGEYDAINSKNVSSLEAFACYMNTWLNVMINIVCKQCCVVHEQEIKRMKNEM